jgi:ABC-type transporter Mla subunit MlaD
MSEADSQAQSGTTAARQMLAALTRASQEITRKFSEGCEQVSKLNFILENKVNGRLSEINDTAEEIVRVQLENLSTEKDAVLVELTELRQEELKVIQSLGKDLRDALSRRLKELVAGLKSEIDEKLATFQDSLVQTETEVSLSVADLREGLNDRLPDHIAAIAKEAGAGKKEFENTLDSQREALSEQASQSLEDVALRCSELKAELEKHGADYLAAIEAFVEELRSAQAEKLAQRLDALAARQEEASRQLHANAGNRENILSSFTSSCRQISEQRVNLHSSVASNLALIYRFELLSIAQETEDQLSIVRSHLHSVLRSCHDYYSEQSNSLLAKFEKGVKEARPQQSEQELLGQEEVPEEVNALFVELRREAGEQVKEVIAAADRNMEESLADFRARLNESCQNICKMSEIGFNEFRKQIADTVESNRALLEDLSQKTDVLEQVVDESKELISAFDEF